MTDIALPVLPAKITLPNRMEWKELMNTPGVIITMIICGTILSLTAIAGVIFLAYTGNDAAVIGTLIAVVLTAVGALLNSRVKRTLDAVNSQKPQE